MKTLLLMKHAESVNDYDLNDDWYRPLSSRGESDARRIGEMLIDEKLVPDLILTSSAIRSDQTACIVAEAFKDACKCYSRDSLYLAEMETYYKEVKPISDKVTKLLFVGHNPAVSHILQVLIEKVMYIPNSAVAQVNLEIDSWQDFNYEIQGKLVQMIKVNPLMPLYRDHKLLSEMNISLQ